MISRTGRVALVVFTLVLSSASLVTSAQEANRSPRQTAEEGLRWIGLLEPLFKGCQLPATLTAPFTDLADIMARNAQARGLATATETARWRAEGAMEGRKRLAGMSVGTGLSSATCQAVASELTAQRATVEATVKQLKDYETQHPPAKP